VTDDVLTERQVRALLRRRIVEAGSQVALAKASGVPQSQISNVLSGKRGRLTAPAILNLLGLKAEVVFRRKRP
jgi:hypothetical protein